MTTKNTSPKRKLKDVTFEHEGAHIALTSKAQGGPANGYDYALVLKSKNFSKEAIQKMQSIQVTLELPEFLRKFFDMYYTDSEVLARLLGYVPPASDNYEYDSEAYYTERLSAFTVMKSLHESGDVLKALAMLDESEYLALLEDQVEIEKAFAELDAKASDTTATVVESENSTNASVEKSVGASGSKVTKSKKETMTLKTKADEAQVELVEKSVVESIQKSLDDAQVELQKARETIQAFEAAAKEAVVKAKTDKVTAIVKDEKIQAAIVKAALSLESDDDFGAFLAAIQAMASAVETTQEFVEKSALFAEQGASTSDETANQESPVARILKAKLTKAK